eukprot:m.4224 g.4224  ORF g.4224 m.4224 type:complete len:954 (+) comp4174_c0_seq1:118-2979(+)
MWNATHLDQQQALFQQGDATVVARVALLRSMAASALRAVIQPVVAKPAELVRAVVGARSDLGDGVLAPRFYMSFSRYSWPCNALPPPPDVTDRGQNLTRPTNTNAPFSCSRTSRRRDVAAAATTHEIWSEDSFTFIPEDVPGARFLNALSDQLSSAAGLQGAGAAGPSRASAAAANVNTSPASTASPTTVRASRTIPAGCNATTGLPWMAVDGVPNPSAGRYDASWMSNMAVAARRVALLVRLTGSAVDSNGRDMQAAVCGLLGTLFVNSSSAVFADLTFAQVVPGTAMGGAVIDFSFRWTTQNWLDAVHAVLGQGGGCGAAVTGGVVEWTRQFSRWLNASFWGISAANRANNHATLYAALAAQLALFHGDTARAREIVVRARDVMLPAQVTGLGQQPEETVRAESIEYSLQNLRTWMGLARLGRHVGVDLWNHVASNGASIRGALNFLVPYVMGQQAWPCRQSNGPVAWVNILAHCLRLAGQGLPGRGYEALLQAVLARHAALITQDTLLQLQLEYPGPATASSTTSTTRPASSSVAWAPPFVPTTRDALSPTSGTDSPFDPSTDLASRVLTTDAPLEVSATGDASSPTSTIPSSAPSTTTTAARTTTVTSTTVTTTSSLRTSTSAASTGARVSSTSRVTVGTRLTTLLTSAAPTTPTRRQTGSTLFTVNATRTLGSGLTTKTTVNRSSSTTTTVSRTSTKATARPLSTVPSSNKTATTTRRTNTTISITRPSTRTSTSTTRFTTTVRTTPFTVLNGTSRPPTRTTSSTRTAPTSSTRTSPRPVTTVISRSSTTTTRPLSATTRPSTATITTTSRVSLKTTTKPVTRTTPRSLNATTTRSVSTSTRPPIRLTTIPTKPSTNTLRTTTSTRATPMSTVSKAASAATVRPSTPKATPVSAVTTKPNATTLKATVISTTKAVTTFSTRKTAVTPSKAGVQSTGSDQGKGSTRKAK